MKGIRILHLSTEKTWRGGENQVRYLLQGLAGLGAQNLVALPPGAKARDAFAAHAELVEIPMRNDMDVWAMLRLAWLVRRRRIDVIHAHTARGHALALGVKRLAPRVKLIVHRRVETKVARGLAGRKYRTRAIDAFVAVSAKIGDDLRAGGVDPARIRVVPSAVDETPYARIPRQEARQNLLREIGRDPQDQAPLYGCVAHLSPRKGVATLIAALGELHAAGEDFAAVIVGEGEEETRLKAMAHAQGLDGKCHFLGFRKNVPWVLTGLCVLVLPSEWEGLGTVLLDGLYAGCALVGAACGGIPEIIKDGVTGLLFPPGQAKPLASCLTRLGQDPALRHRLNDHGTHWARERFSLAAMVAGITDVYRSILGKP